MNTKPLDCEEALRALVDFLDGELPLAAQQDVHQHLETCHSCYSRAEFERRLAEQLASLGRHALEPDFARRIRSLLAAIDENPEHQER